MNDLRRQRTGLCHVYTGDGKGKTTAALGVCLRAIGHGYRCRIIQFMKGNIDYGELEAARLLAPQLSIFQGGRETFVTKSAPDPVDQLLAQHALEIARHDLMSNEWDLVVFDEVNVALDYKLFSVDEVLDLIKRKPAFVELILTGRYAPQQILEAADLVTEMCEVKHYFHKGTTSREGIEF